MAPGLEKEPHPVPPPPPPRTQGLSSPNRIPGAAAPVGEHPPHPPQKKKNHPKNPKRAHSCHHACSNGPGRKKGKGPAGLRSPAGSSEAAVRCRDRPGKGPAAGRDPRPEPPLSARLPFSSPISRLNPPNPHLSIRGVKKPARRAVPR